MRRRIYMGFDARDNTAYRVAAKSLCGLATGEVDVIPLYDWQLRYRGQYWRTYWVDEKGQRTDGTDGKPFSTDFSFTRFLVPLLEDYGDDLVAFVDPDVLFRADVQELFTLAEDLGAHDKAVMCVQHNHVPVETEKMAGLRQTVYARKNWSSLMIMKPSLCQNLTKFVVNAWTGTQLHAMCWAPDDLIGSLPLEWNYLVGTTDPKDVPNPAMVHYTLGTPDLPGYEDCEYATEWWDVHETLGI